MEFKGIDLSTKYIHPSTWNWLISMENDDDAPLNLSTYDEIYGRGYGMVVWTYSVDLDDERIPQDLGIILRAAINHEWRFVVIDGDGNDSDLFTSYEEEWR